MTHVILAGFDPSTFSIFVVMVLGGVILNLPLSMDPRVPDDRDHLTCQRPLRARLAATYLAGIFGFFLVEMYWQFLTQPFHRGDGEGLLLGTLFLGPLELLFLYASSPFRLRFDLRDGTYVMRDGFFPLFWTRHGTRDEIECLTIFGWYAKSQGCRVYAVSVRWKKLGLLRRRSSRLDWFDNQWDAEQEAGEMARWLGVPRGDTRIQGVRSEQR